ncbi:prephenate dehydratase [Staphylococcus pasteuri]|uniref:prephenate dehydratase n=1 Tax=Staphylococcus pasteuri TaxID=45972 RepID=UPI000D388B74|nr:prephenate dehydratase domain-containing protein [Staphylococcus pasteuri]PTU87335.1 prephenate dehydratase [Staphylococcus pasteuri]RFD72515.1 prephenate dehydratase [Staphylococcus pasteuri]RIO54132.1 prephenate dehydratase [Staphylococcus pasteuri]
MKIYYLGPKGTFSYLASQKYVEQLKLQNIDFVPKANLYEVIKCASQDDDTIGLVPIENSIEGTINIVADSLAKQDVYAHGELLLDIDFALYGQSGSQIEDIKKVYSIAPAISQTSNYIMNHHFDYDYVDSTVKGFEMISKHVGAIAPVNSGEDYGFQQLDTHIQDFPHNATRFLIIKNHAQFDVNANTTMFLITPKFDKPGLLASILNTFALFNINLSWIESRPLKTKLGQYHFFVQADAQLSNDIEKVITILNTLDFETKLIGAFRK